MPRNYFKLDLYFFEHPKVVDLSHAATVLFLASVAYSNRRETDGFIAGPIVRKLIDVEPNDVTRGVTRDSRYGHTQLAEELVQASLWAPVEGGWQIHDFFDHNDSSEERAARRDAEREGNRARQRRYRERKQAGNPNLTEGNGRDASLLSVSNALSHPIEVEVTEKRREKINTVVALARPVADETQAIFNAWRASTGKARAKLDPKRRKRIQQALKAYPPEDILDAVVGWKNSPHHCGQNERATVYNDLDLLLRDAEHIERFRDLARHGPAPPAAGRRTTQALGTYQAMLDNPPEEVNVNGNGVGTVGGDRRPAQRELARPAD